MTVAISGKLVASNAHTKRIVVTGLESGYAKVSVAAGALDRELQVWVPSCDEVSMSVAAMEVPQSRTWVNALISVAATFLYVSIF